MVAGLVDPLQRRRWVDFENGFRSHMKVKRLSIHSQQVRHKYHATPYQFFAARRKEEIVAGTILQLQHHLLFCNHGEW